MLIKDERIYEHTNNCNAEKPKGHGAQTLKKAYLWRVEKRGGRIDPEALTEDSHKGPVSNCQSSWNKANHGDES